MTVQEYVELNRRLSLENEIRQARYCQELRDKERLELQRRQTQAAEYEAHGPNRSGLVGLLIVGLIISFAVGVVVMALWGSWLVWRGYQRWTGRNRSNDNSPHTPDPAAEDDLLDLIRQEGIDPSTVKAGIEEALRRSRRH